ncbi:type II toxin-antitoxin system RelE/ParE family toxin [Dongia sp.]|uniref:type II toxin-antitoxin system RelE/ParE family toxin n=1 Tax=Dongia sp. TaxID=1977262 RepID=UPI0035AF71DE
MTFRVQLTAGAVRDLEEIASYIAGHSSLAGAGRLLDGILDIVSALEAMPERGRMAPELVDYGFSAIRERFFKPYRILYRIDGQDVRILLIADGRRDLRELLLRRLLD